MNSQDLKTIAVIGAGAMGQQIAMNTAINGRKLGYNVILCDSLKRLLRKLLPGPIPI